MSTDQSKEIFVSLILIPKEGKMAEVSGQKCCLLATQVCWLTLVHSS